MNPAGNSLPTRRSSVRAVSTLVAILAALTSAPATAQDRLLWGSLKPGPHAVGYQTVYQLDHTREYDPEYVADATELPVHRPRPILICMWYPARTTRARPTAYRQYLEIPSDDAQLAPFVQRLTYHIREVVCEETMGKIPRRLTPAEAAAFDRFLATKVFAERNAPAAVGRFPVVIYHPGLGGSHEDNSVLFEYLASHGYVVLSSAYPDADASSVSIAGDLICSFRDMECLIPPCPRAAVRRRRPARRHGAQLRRVCGPCLGRRAGFDGPCTGVARLRA